MVLPSRVSCMSSSSPSPLKGWRTAPPAIALISGAELRAPCDVLAVGRIAGTGIGTGRGGEFAWIAALDGDGVEIGIGAGSGDGVGIHGVADFLAVGGDVVIVGAAEREGRDVVRAGCEILGRAAGGGNRQQVAAAFPLPRGPMAKEQVGVDACVDLIGLVGLQVFLVAGIIGAAFGIDVGGEDEVLAVAREEHAVGFGGESGHLFGVAAIGVHDPDLRGAGAIGDVGDVLGIG